MEAKANQLGWMSQFSNLFIKKNESTYYSEIYEKTKLQKKYLQRNTK